MRKMSYLLLATLAWAAQVNGNGNDEQYKVVKESPIHEAFVVKESGSLILEAVPNAPPAKITELIPKQNDNEEIWIPGYWAWSRKFGVYLWVSGVWRKPPPGLQWIPGKWKSYPQGWVWISGLWSNVNQEDLVYLENPPPDPIDQRVPSPPAAAENYFWVPGNWQFDKSLKQYVWHSGRWDLIGIHWNYCPSHYVWREKGYVFVPGFWDWPMNKRGVAFASIMVNPDAIETVVYEPTQVLDPLFVMEQIFPYWPDYSCLFHAHYYFYFDVWNAWGAVPPWWNWSAWWSFPTSAQWALWWWWTHPGYPNPTWLTDAAAQSLSPPPQFVLEMMQKIDPPAFVTPNGVVGQNALLKALIQVTGINLPILPSDPKQILQIQGVANPQNAEGPFLSPKGTGQPVAQPPEKPFFGPATETLKTAPRRVVLPPRPIVTDTTPPVQPNNKPPVSQKNGNNAQAPATRPSTSTYQPYAYYPQQQQSNYAYPQQQQNYYYPQQPPQQPNPPMRNPQQGYVIPYEYPQAPMQTLHQGHFMTRPQPQVNPAGPKVNPTPGDYSTLPGQ